VVCKAVVALSVLLHDILLAVLTYPLGSRGAHFEKMLYDHKEVNSVRTHWSGTSLLCECYGKCCEGRFDPYGNAISNEHIF
jgi:hypothetical protein